MHPLARGILGAVRHPLLVLDAALRIRAANPAFHAAFRVPDGEAEGRLLRDLDGGRWDVPGLLGGLERVAATGRGFDGLEVRRDSPEAGPRDLLLSAQRAPGDDADSPFVLLLAIEDVTRQKRAEEGFRASEERYRLVAYAANDAVWDWDLATDAVFWSEGVRVRFGHPAGGVGPDAAWWAGNIHPADRDRVVGGIHAAIGGRGELWEAEYRFRRADGSYAEVADRGRVVRDASGRGVRMVGSMTDVTDRRRAEGRHARDALLLAGVRDAIAVTDPGGVVTYWNAGAERLFGWTAAEVVGRPMADRFPEEARPAIAAEIARLTAGGEWSGEFEDWRRDGSRVWIDARVSRIVGPGGDVIGVLGLSHDITARKRAEAALQASEERYRSLVAAAAAIVWDMSPDGEFEAEQPGWAAFTGQSFDDYRGRGWLAAIHPDDRADTARRWAAAVADGAACRVEQRVRRADGEYRHMTARAVPILGPGGAVREWVGVHADVTDRTRAEASLVESQGRLALATETARVGIWDWDPVADTAVWDARVCALHGTSAREFGGAAGAWRAALHPDDRDRAGAELAAAVAGTKDFHTEYRVVWPGGEVRYLEGHAVVQRDAGGRATRVVGVNRDISERRRAVEALRDREERLRAMLSATPDVFILVDGADRYREVETRHPEKLVAPRDALLGRTVGEVLPPDTARAMTALLHAARRTGEVQVAEYPLTLAGGVSWFEARIVSVGGDGAALVVVRDVTVRKEFADALEASNRLYRLLADHMHDVVSLMGDDGACRYVSPSCERLAGHTPAETLRAGLSGLAHPDDRAAAEQGWAAAAAGGTATVEWRCRHRDGHYLWVETVFTPVGGRQADARVVASSRDATARRAAEDRSRQAQKMEAVGQLAGGVAHDFNNLLTVITGYADVVAAGLPADHPCREPVAEIAGAADRAAALTRQLLAFSRQTVLEPRALDVNALVRGTERMLRRLIGEDVRLVTRLAPDPVTARADPGQLEQAVVNLCVNARDAMPAGGTLTIETRGAVLGQADLGGSPDVRPGRYVVLAVSDTGEGMTPGVMARVFEPFFTTKGVGRGTGLGLAMVFGFVKQSGGHVAVWSEPGQGATFELYLPREEAPAAAGGPGTRAAAGARGAETVLLVEDEEVVRTLARRVLGMRGYAVLEAGDGPEAIRLADGHAGPVHLLLTDVVMPGGMGGRQVAEAVVARHPGARVLYMSGYTDDAVVQHGVRDATVHFLQKPFTPAALAGKVRAVLDGTD